MAMDHEHLVRLASGGDVEALVDLTRRFQHFAFGSALALASWRTIMSESASPPAPSMR
jgi:hypothetical protein